MSVCGLYVCMYVCVCERFGISDRDIIAEQGEKCTALVQRGRGLFSLTGGLWFS